MKPEIKHQNKGCEVSQNNQMKEVKVQNLECRCGVPRLKREKPLRVVRPNMAVLESASSLAAVGMDAVAVVPVVSNIPYLSAYIYTHNGYRARYARIALTEVIA